jgi:hypothetical protein
MMMPTSLPRLKGFRPRRYHMSAQNYRQSRATAFEFRTDFTGQMTA